MTSSLRSLFLLLALLSTQISVAQYKHIFIRCEDIHGHHLMNDTIRVPQDVCFFLQPPVIPYYRAVNYDENGTNVCIQTDAYMTMLYDTEAYMGFHTLKEETIDAIKENMSLVLMEEVNHSPMVWSVLPNHEILQRRDLSRGGHDAYATWVMKQHNGGWAILNEATGLYVAEVQNDKTVKTSTIPQAFSLAKKAGTVWTLTDTKTQHAIDLRLSHHDRRLYYALQILCSDTEGKNLRADSTVLIPAGEAYTAGAPTIEGYALVNTTSSLSSFDPIGENGWVEYIYEATTTNGISALPTNTPHTSPVFDLFGRRANAPKKGLYLRDGQKFLLP